MIEFILGLLTVGVMMMLFILFIALIGWLVEKIGPQNHRG